MGRRSARRAQRAAAARGRPARGRGPRQRRPAMTTILVPTAGSPTDASVFRTALLAARPLAAHLAFLHVYIEATEAITHTAHAEFARGAALTACLSGLTAEAETRSAAAQRSV